MIEFILMLSGALLWTAVVCAAIAWWVLKYLQDER
jgi:hypothetical protein